MDTTTIVIFVIVILVIAVIIAVGGYFLYKRERYDKNTVIISPSQKGGMAAQFPGPTRSTPERPALVLFYADYCPHCHSMMPEWDSLQRLAAPRYAVLKFEAKDPEMANNQVSGFPTIRLFPKGYSAGAKYIEYSGNRTAEDILNFADQNLASRASRQ